MATEFHMQIDRPRAKYTCIRLWIGLLHQRKTSKGRHLLVKCTNDIQLTRAEGSVSAWAVFRSWVVVGLQLIELIDLINVV